MASRRPRGAGSDAGVPADDAPGTDVTPPADARDDAAAGAVEDTPDGVGDEADEADEAGAVRDEDEVGEEDEGAAPGRRRPALGVRTLAICTLVALVAALATGLLVSRLTDGGDDDVAGPEGTLTLAEQVPDVPLTRFDGSTVDLSDYEGQPLVVNFWGSWCQPCVDEMPDLQAVHTSLGEDVAFLGVNIRDEPEAAQALAERTGVTYDLVQDLDGELTRALGVTNFPTTVLILPDGTVIDTIQRKVSTERLCEKVTQSLLGGSTQECG